MRSTPSGAPAGFLGGQFAPAPAVVAGRRYCGKTRPDRGVSGDQRVLCGDEIPDRASGAGLRAAEADQ
jgi:hypothetical protein